MTAPALTVSDGDQGLRVRNLRKSYRNRPVHLDASPIYQVENVRKPVHIFHGLEDDVVPPQASEEWVNALRQAGKTFEYKTYAGEGHGFLMRRTQLDFYSRMERFLDWYLIV